MNDPQSHALLRFWFGNDDLHAPIDDATRGAWFRVDTTFDAKLRDDFGDLIVPAREGALGAWESTDQGALALMLLLDQLPRNLFRGDAQAFASDSAAVALADRVIARGVDQRVSTSRRMFFYLPYEHAEDLARQDEAMACFRALVAAATGADVGLAQSTLQYAEKHRELIARFGRFPHRNAALGRASTPEEVELLSSWRGF